MPRGGSPCLLLKRSRSPKGNPGKWRFPGGKIDPGESFDEALLREVAKERHSKVGRAKHPALAESAQVPHRVEESTTQGTQP